MQYPLSQGAGQLIQKYNVIISLQLKSPL